MYYNIYFVRVIRVSLDRCESIAIQYKRQMAWHFMCGYRPRRSTDRYRKQLETRLMQCHRLNWNYMLSLSKIQLTWLHDKVT